MKLSKIFLSLIIVLFLGCGSNNKIEKIDSAINLDWYKYSLSKMNENTLESSNENQIRFIVAQPFGVDDYLLGIKDLETEFLIYRKTILKVDKKTFDSEGILVKSKDFRNQWNKLLKIFETKESDKLEKGEVGDRPTWNVEIKNNSSYQLKIGILEKEDIAWVKQIFELTPYGVPEQLPYDF